MSVPVIDPKCARCGWTFDHHPGGFCPDQVGTDGLVDVEGAKSFEWPEDDGDGVDLGSAA